jgi:hypothetical protein
MLPMAPSPRFLRHLVILIRTIRPRVRITISLG